MPCRDDRDSPLVVYREGHDPCYHQKSQALQARLDELTDLLCQAGRARHNKTEIPRAVLAWWDEHCKLDAARGEFW